MPEMILPPAPSQENLLAPGRRRFLQLAAATVAEMIAQPVVKAAGFWDLPRELWLRRPATGEEIRAIYWAQGQLVPAGYMAICQLLRDTHRNQAVQMDLVALDVLRGVHGWLQGFGINQPVQVNSGYRHPTTNASEGGVRNSQHILGKAVDITIHGVRAEQVGRFGQYLAGGGVGFYPQRNFTHLDSGRVRAWRG